MILFFSGAFAMVGLFGLFGAGYLIGKKDTPKNLTRPPTDVDDEVKRKRKQMHEHFNKLMNYDVDTAIGRKKV